MHAVFLHHGLWGNHTHFDYVIEQLMERHCGKLTIGSLDINHGVKTYDGIDVCGDKAVDWIEQFLKKHDDVTQVSFLGYSLGGLVLRYVIGKLLLKGFFDKYEPINFITFASPHLGASKPSDRKVFHSLFNFMASKALQKFKSKAVFANIKNDRAVTYTSASIRNSNPFIKHRNFEGYPTLVSWDPTRIGPSKLDWKWHEIRTIAIALSISPLIIPVVLVMMFIVMPLISLKRYFTGTDREPDTAWVEQHFGNSNQDGKVSLQDRKKLRRWMVKTLDSLSWTRVDCYLRFTNAHAGLINRLKNKNSPFKDVIEYLLDKNFHKLPMNPLERHGSPMQVLEEITKLIGEIKRLGKPDEKGRVVVKFGVLVMDDRCSNIFEGIVGTLKAAKKRKIVDFQGEILLQGPHNNVDVILLQDNPPLIE